VIFLAQLYGVPLGPPELATIAFLSVITTFSVPGIPGGSIIVMVPVLTAANLPVDGIGLLLGVDTIPDMFRTTTNVTGDMAAASVLSRYESTDVTSDEAAVVAATGITTS
jgi:Na+/H+-dicarboxylate symporter